MSGSVTSETSSSPALSVSLQQAQKIIQKHVGLSEGSNDSLRITKLEEIKDYGYSVAGGSKIYIVDLHGGDADAHGKATTASCFLTISAPSSERNTLPLITHLLSLIRSNTQIPISDPILDTTRDLIPFDFLLSPPTPFPSSSIITLHDAKAQGLLNEQLQAMIDLQMGSFLAQMHQNVQNDWFGLPVLPPRGTVPTPGAPQRPPAEAEPECYSWQETFTTLFESLLSSVKTKLSSQHPDADPDNQDDALGIPFTAIHSAMSRAIAFFLFDDVEVPSLVWFTGFDTDIYLSLPTHGSTKTPGIVAILPSMPHMLWGDPLLESFFIPLAEPGGVEKSKALIEGYTGAGGAPLISFARQKTKRVWYTLYLALSVLNEYLSLSTGSSSQALEEKRKWAFDTIRTCADVLKTAPCY
ncbi:hypothetical protein DFP72DRAFT_805220 [Ephemerocybe angulata]|uniref:Uncharacterized protein n=1 Tax=Ephemerocybe angulata TaxID=980116 RepID=A0A8H6IAC5_9AGAR|nr:hypothetical protein DFP72DRAFT_805220 [Tulosesus angulatus]